MMKNTEKSVLSYIPIISTFIIQSTTRENFFSMAYITLKNENLPGIIGLFDYRPETAKPLSALAEVLLRGPSTLSRGEREIIASSVSHWNGCHFCHTSHGAAAASHLTYGLELIDDIKIGLKDTPATPKLKALLNVANKVQKGGGGCY